jgi:hypothetical protein
VGDHNGHVTTNRLLLHLGWFNLFGHLSRLPKIRLLE